MIVREILIQESAELKKFGIQTSSIDASLLLCSVLNISREKLIAIDTDEIRQDNIEAFHTLIKRRLNGECTAYILGKKEFYGLEFKVNCSVLVPRPETETLVEAALEILQKGNRDRGLESGDVVRVLDLCTGSGAVAIALKHEMPEIEVTATDISEQALEVAKENANRLLGEDQIKFYPGDLYEALPSLQSPVPGAYSMILSNPPYIPTEEIKTLSIEVQNEPHIALDGGSFGLEIIERIIEKAPKYLLKGGHLLMEADLRQTDKIFSLLDKYGFTGIKSYKDLSGKNRVIGGKFDT